MRNSGILISELPESLVTFSAAVIFSAAGCGLELCLVEEGILVLPATPLDCRGLLATSTAPVLSSLKPVAITVTVT